jgi:type II secretory pathway pseudopilin PulG
MDQFLNFNFAKADSRSHSIVKNSRGVSLVEVMIVIGIMSFVALTMASMLSDMTKAQAALEEKLAAIEAGNGLNRVFADSDICTAQLIQSGQPVDLTLKGTEIEYNAIKLGIDTTSPVIVEKDKSLPGYKNNKMKVQSIVLKNIMFISGNNFSGDFEVTLDPKTTVRALKPFGVKSIIFSAAPPHTASTVAGCSTKTGGVGDWVVMPAASGSINQAPDDGMLIITSANNRGINFSSGSTAASLADPSNIKATVSARDKYGQGVEFLSIPIKKDEFWSAQSIGGSEPMTSIFFRPIQ